MGAAISRLQGLNLRAKLLVLLLGSLAVIFTISASITIYRATSSSSEQSKAAAERQASVIADAVATFGITGDMVGLQFYLDALKEDPNLGDVHVIRGQITIDDFGEREGANARDDMEKTVLASGESAVNQDKTNHQYRVVLPTLAKETCTGCHNASVGDVLGVTSVSISTESSDTATTALAVEMGSIFIIALIIEFTLFALALTYKVIRPLNVLVSGLTEGAESVEDSSENLSGVSGKLAENASEQAASLEETSASLEELASMTDSNVQSAQESDALAGQVRHAVEQGAAAIENMNRAISQIDESAGKTAQIIKTIDEIAFQTNLLALNAAVEAARAGDAGKGFAVVAEEVRNLAQRSAEAAKNTSGLIEGSLAHTKEGVRVSGEVGSVLEEIRETTGKLVTLISEVASASKEQANGIQEVNKAVSVMDKATQSNAAEAEQAAAASELLGKQSRDLAYMVEMLVEMVGANRHMRAALDYHGNGNVYDDEEVVVPVDRRLT